MPYGTVLVRVRVPSCRTIILRVTALRATTASCDSRGSIHSSHGPGTSAWEKNAIFTCAGHNRIISPGIPSGIIDTRNTTDIIDTLGFIGGFHPAPFGIVEIPGAFDDISA